MATCEIASGRSDIRESDELEALSKLHNEGVLDAAELAASKARVLQAQRESVLAAAGVSEAGAVAAVAVRGCAHRDGTDDRMVGRHEDELARGHLVHAPCCDAHILWRCPFGPPPSRQPEQSIVPGQKQGRAKAVGAEPK